MFVAVIRNIEVVEKVLTIRANTLWFGALINAKAAALANPTKILSSD